MEIILILLKNFINDCLRIIHNRQRYTQSADIAEKYR